MPATPAISQITTTKAWRVASPHELHERFAQLATLIDPSKLLIQEIVPGGGEMRVRRPTRGPVQGGRAPLLVVRCPGRRLGVPVVRSRVRETTALGVQLTRDLIGVERKCIHTLLRNGRLTDEARRRIERDLDLEEAGLANREYRKIPL